MTVRNQAQCSMKYYIQILLLHMRVIILCGNFIPVRVSGENLPQLDDKSF